MGNPKTKGRMIKRSISQSEGFAKLSPPAAVLFCMIIPHLNSYGKLNGEPFFLKGAICPRIKYLTPVNIVTYMKQITEMTNMKWFKVRGLWYIHCLNFLTNHQDLRIERLGLDILPSYSGVSQEYLGVSPPELEVEVKEEVEEEGNSVELPEWLNKDAWFDFLDMRKGLKKPMKEKAIKLAINKLSGLRDAGEDPQQVLEQSIMNSWQGLFAVKKDRRPWEDKYL